ncbi:MAG: VWA domain-containing protein [Candidatus Acidiferrales bacterium]
MIRTFSNSLHRLGLPALFSVAFTFLFRAILLSAQTSAPEQNSGATAALKVNAELVRIEVSVADKHANLLGGLTQTNFRVLDEGVERPLTFFAPVETPAQILVLVETSPAVYLIHRQHLEAAYSLLDGLAPDDQVALATYDQTPRVLLPPTSDKAALARALVSLQYNLGMAELNFYDSVGAALDSLAALTGKKALVLLTTGLDSSPPGHWENLVAKLKASDVVIFPVALGGSLRDADKPKSKSSSRPKSKKPVENEANNSLGKQQDAVTQRDPELSFERANNALLSIAQISGGRAYFPGSAEDFAPIYREIASTLRHQYVLGFEPTVHDGRFHSLEIHITDSNGQPMAAAKSREGYRVYARQGYLAPAP